MSCRSVSDVCSAAVRLESQRNVIIPENRVIIEYDEDGTAMLKIHDVTPADDGLYKCVAVNDAGSTSTSCTLTVIGTLNFIVKRLKCESSAIAKIFFRFS